MSKNNNKKLIAVWGTLRKGHGNYHRYLKDNSKFLGTDTLPNHSKSGLMLSKSDDDEVEVDLFEVNQETYENIDSMERSCGFFARETELESGKEAMVWFNRSYVKV